MSTPSMLVIVEPATTSVVVLELQDDDDDVVVLPGSEDATITVAEVMEGLPGPAGEVEDYIHTQSSASDTWTVNHNLGRRPDVTVLSNGGVQMFASVTHVSINQVIIQFATPQQGTVRCI